jgi:hypothetical protein
MRLGPAEVAHLIEHGQIAAEMAFGPSSKLGYVLCASPSAKTVGATFDDNTIRVEIPREMAQVWAASDSVALQGVQPAMAGRSLRILIEKDFECLDPRGNEPGAIFYPHPDK